MPRKIGRKQAIESAYSLLREHCDEFIVLLNHAGDTKMTTQISMHSHTSQRVGGVLYGWIEGSASGEMYSLLGGGRAEWDAKLRSSADPADLMGSSKQEADDEDEDG